MDIFCIIAFRHAKGIVRSVFKSLSRIVLPYVHRDHGFNINFIRDLFYRLVKLGDHMSAVHTAPDRHDSKKPSEDTPPKPGVLTILCPVTGQEQQSNQ